MRTLCECERIQLKGKLAFRQKPIHTMYGCCTNRLDEVRQLAVYAFAVDFPFLMLSQVVRKSQ